jgi:protein-tyrosine phosphatase
MPVFNKMDCCSYFIKNRALFGSFPTQASVKELEKHNVRYFINLTTPDEKRIVPYHTDYTCLSYPIEDRGVPDDYVTFAKFIVRVSSIIKGLKNDEKIYVHCKGGHGRSGLVVAVLISNIFHLSSGDAIEYTSKCHSNRSVMRDKWRRLGSPQTYTQKKFVYKSFQPLNHNRLYKVNNKYGTYEISIRDVGAFSSIYQVLDAYKKIWDEDNNSPVFACFKSKSWNESLKEQIIYNAMELQFSIHNEIRTNLINSCLRPIKAHLDNDYFWGIGKDGNGLNKLGKILEEIRLLYLLMEDEIY